MAGSQSPPGLDRRGQQKVDVPEPVIWSHQKEPESQQSCHYCLRHHWKQKMRKNILMSPVSTLKLSTHDQPYLAAKAKGALCNIEQEEESGRGWGSRDVTETQKQTEKGQPPIAPRQLPWWWLVSCHFRAGDTDAWTGWLCQQSEAGLRLDPALHVCLHSLGKTRGTQEHQEQDEKKSLRFKEEQSPVVWQHLCLFWPSSHCSTPERKILSSNCPGFLLWGQRVVFYLICVCRLFRFWGFVVVVLTRSIHCSVGHL